MDAVRALEVRQSALDRQLRFAVAVDRVLGMCFENRRFDRLAVRRARRREHEWMYAGSGHRLEYRERADNVVPVILRGFAHRLAYVQKRRKVHDRKHAVACERVPDRNAIGDIRADEVTPFDGFSMAGHEIVEHDDVIAGSCERLTGMAADIA